MYMLNKGKTAPARDLRKVFAAIAEAALVEIVRLRGPFLGGSAEKHRIRWVRYVQHEICIYEVVECLEEDGEEAKTGEEARESGDYPVGGFFVT